MIDAHVGADPLIRLREHCLAQWKLQQCLLGRPQVDHLARDERLRHTQPNSEM